MRVYRTRLESSTWSWCERSEFITPDRSGTLGADQSLFELSQGEMLHSPTGLSSIAGGYRWRVQIRVVVMFSARQSLSRPNQVFRGILLSDSRKHASVKRGNWLSLLIGRCTTAAVWRLQLSRGLFDGVGTLDLDSTERRHKRTASSLPWRNHSSLESNADAWKKTRAYTYIRLRSNH